MKTFIDKCALGEVLDPAMEIYDEVGRWHDSPLDLPPLDEWLGMTWDEYKRWVQDASYLKIIIKNRRDLKK